MHIKFISTTIQSILLAKLGSLLQLQLREIQIQQL